MRVKFRPSSLLACLIFAAVALCLPIGRVMGQSTTGGFDPLELLKSMSPEQQEAILSRFGLGSVAGTSAETGTQKGQQPPRTRAEVRREREKQKLANPVLEGEDWVIIEIDFSLAPRPASAQPSPSSGGLPAIPNLQALQAAAAASGLGGGSAAAASGAAAPRSAATERTFSDEDKKHLQDLIDLVRSGNPYRLSRDGALTLPGFSPIALLGLSDEQATLRLKVEPAFRDLDIRLTHEPLKKTGLEGLKPFGYELFEAAVPSTFAPATNVPVPSDYVIGPGDQLEVQLYGNTNRTMKLSVGRDGTVSFPELGPISVVGKHFTSVKAEIEARVAQQRIGVRASVSIADTKSIRVLVVGDAWSPGSYTISGLSTVTSALFAAGGVELTGSLRRIELKRNGVLIRTLDLYDLLLHGNNADDAKLLQGDVVFIPPVGRTVGVDGEVRRPAIYEIKDEASVADVLELAGGLTPEADQVAVLTRIDEQQHRIVLPVDLRAPASRAQRVRNGDLLRVDRLRPTLDAAVMVQGHVFTPGAFPYRQGMRLSDVIHSVDQLQPDADIHYLLIRRELPPDRRIGVVSADLAAALKAPGSGADTELLPRDRIIVFDLTTGRGQLVQPVLDELRLQSSATRPAEVVHVEGRVRVPGDYPLEAGMTVADLIRAGGGLTDDAYRGQAELTRYQVVNGVTRRTEIRDVDLTAALRGDAAGNALLEPFDSLSVKAVSQWDAQYVVTLSGEVRFPGHYSIKRGDTLRSVIARAGGLTEFAFPEGSVFTRVELKEREQEQLNMLMTRLKTDLGALALQTAAAQGGAGSGAANTLAIGQSLLGQLRATKAVGRLVIDLPRTMREPPGSAQDVIMRDGDQLIVPKFQQEVTVIGEVQASASHLYSPKISRDGYISRSGGVTRRADRDMIYVVRANGSVVANQGSRWFHNAAGVQINPGDTIVVPLNAEHLPPLPLWQAVTGIMYNLAIAAAAVHAL